jgi:hypothetical protein
VRSIGGLILGVLAFLTTSAAAAPAIVVTAPSLGAVARPTLLVQASCTDPGPAGCLEFQARIGGATGPIVATGATTIDQSIDLAAYDGQATTLWIAAHDDAGQWTEIAVPIWVEASPVLTPVATVVGEVLDVDATRVLYLDPTAVVRVRRRTDGAESVLGPVREVRFGRLTSTGAIYASREGAPGCATGEALYEWHGSGAVVEVDRACDAVTARWIIDGDWGARRDSPLDVTRRDLRVGVETAVRLPMTISRGHTAMTRFDVGPNGDVHALLQQPYSFPAWDHFRDRAGVQNVDALAADTSSTPPVALAADSVGWATALCGQYTGAPPTCAVYRCLAPGVGCGYGVSWVDVGIRDGIMLTGGWLYLRYNTGGFPAGTPVVGALGRIAPSTNPPSTMLVGGAGDTFEAVTTFGAATMLRSTGRAVLDVAGTLHPIGTNVGRGLFVGPDACVAIGGTVFQVATPTGGSMRAAPDQALASSGCQAGGDAGVIVGLIAIAVLAIGRRRRLRGVLLIVLLAAGCPGRGSAPAVDAGPADAAIDAQVVDAHAVDARPGDAGPPEPGCAIDRRFDVAGAGLPAAEIAVVDTGADLLLLFTDGPVGTLAPLRWTRVSYTGDRLVAPTLLTTAARRPLLAVRDALVQAAYLTATGLTQQRFVGGTPATATDPRLPSARRVGPWPRLGRPLRRVHDGHVVRTDLRDLATERRRRTALARRARHLAGLVAHRRHRRRHSHASTSAPRLRRLHDARAHGLRSLGRRWDHHHRADAPRRPHRHRARAHPPRHHVPGVDRVERRRHRAHRRDRALSPRRRRHHPRRARAHDGRDRQRRRRGRLPGRDRRVAPPLHRRSRRLRAGPGVRPRRGARSARAHRRRHRAGDRRRRSRPHRDVHAVITRPMTQPEPRRLSNADEDRRRATVRPCLATHSDGCIGSPILIRRPLIRRCGWRASAPWRVGSQKSYRSIRA